MSKIFDSQVKHYKEKFHSTVDNVTFKSIENFGKMHGVNADTIKEGLNSNSEDFRRFVYSYSKTLMPGHVSCTTYAAVVAVIASNFGVKYKAYSGFCLPKSNPRYEAEKASFESKKGSDEHPCLATHVFVEINGVAFEYYNGDTSNIDHIDCVEI